MKTTKRGPKESKAPRTQIRQDLARNLSLELARLYPQVETKTERILLLEKQTGFPHSTAARIMNGEKSPLVDRLDELAEALGVPAYRLLLPAERVPTGPRDHGDTTIIRQAPVFEESERPVLHSSRKIEDAARNRRARRYGAARRNKT